MAESTSAQFELMLFRYRKVLEKLWSFLSSALTHLRISIHILYVVEWTATISNLKLSN